MMKPEPSELTRRGASIRIVAALAAVVLEEFVEELLHRRAGRQVGQVVDARVDFLRRRNVDDGVDDLFGDVGDVVRTARRRRPRRQEHDRRRKRGDRRAALHAVGQGGEPRIAAREPIRAWTSALLASRHAGEDLTSRKCLPSHSGTQEPNAAQACRLPATRRPDWGGKAAPFRKLVSRAPARRSSTPTNAETMPAMRNGPSGMFQHASPWCAWRRPGTPQEKCLRSQRTGRARRGNPTSTRPAGRDPLRLTQSLLFRGAARMRRRALAGRRPACRQAASCRTDRRNSGRNPNPAAAPDGYRPSACSVRRPASSGRRRRNPDPGRRPRRRCGCASASPSPRICSDC